jgi:hypothetical protein
MGAEPLRAHGAQQLQLYEKPIHRALQPRPTTKLCATCRAREARYGFKQECGDTASERGAGRPHTLCFECFRMELDRRHVLAGRRARGWTAEQALLPLTETLHKLTLRRRRAQIAARHALQT